jgi:DNA-binding beta-propeller fold protein YncE
MPPLRLTSLLHTALPDLSDNGRALLSALGCLNGHPPCPRELAEWLGFHDRYQLARALRREGLPPLEVISGWARTLYWVLEAETSGVSLRELADRERVDPAVAYRLVRRVTGQRWSEVRREGLAVTLLHFRDRCANGKRRAPRIPQPLAVAVGDRPLRPVARPAPARTSGVALRPTPRHPPGHRVVQTVGERVPVGGAPFDIALTAYGDVLVTRSHASAVAILHPNPLRVVSTIRVGPAPTRIVPGGGRSRWAYVTSQFAEAVCVVDLERKQHVGSIPVPGQPLGAAMAPDGVTLFATTNQDRVVTIAAPQRAALGSAPVPLGGPELTVHPSGRWVYVPCWRAGVVIEVDASTLDTVRRFDVGGIAQEAVVSSDGQSLYVANESGWLDVIHLPSGRRTAAVDFGTPALAVALSPDERYVFVSLMTAGRVVVLQRQGLVERAAIHTGGRPRHLVADQRGDALLVANEDGWVDLLR